MPIMIPNPNLEIFIYELPELLNSVIARIRHCEHIFDCVYKTNGFMQAKMGRTNSSVANSSVANQSRYYIYYILDCFAALAMTE